MRVHPEDERAVVVLHTNDIHATITPAREEQEEGRVELEWNDFVTNTWTETHPNLPAALHRLAEIVA